MRRGPRILGVPLPLLRTPQETPSDPWMENPPECQLIVGADKARIMLMLIMMGLPGLTFFPSSLASLSFLTAYPFSYLSLPASSPFFGPSSSLPSRRCLKERGQSFRSLARRRRLAKDTNRGFPILGILSTFWPNSRCAKGSCPSWTPLFNPQSGKAKPMEPKAGRFLYIIQPEYTTPQEGDPKGKIQRGTQFG